MIGYFRVDPSGVEIFDVPWVLHAVSNRRKLQIIWNENILEGRVLFFKTNESLLRKMLAKREIIKFDIGRLYIETFLKLCREQQTKKVKREIGDLGYLIIEEARDYIELDDLDENSPNRDIEHVCENEDYQLEDEDYEENWWKRGEKPPF